MGQAADTTAEGVRLCGVHESQGLSGRWDKENLSVRKRKGFKDSDFIDNRNLASE
jgi:hypothetical protein